MMMMRRRRRITMMMMVMTMMMMLSGKGIGLGGGFWVLPHHAVTLGKSVMPLLSFRLICGIWG